MQFARTLKPKVANCKSNHIRDHATQRNQAQQTTRLSASPSRTAYSSSCKHCSFGLLWNGPPLIECKRSMHHSILARSTVALHSSNSPVVVVSCTFPKCSQRRFMQSQRPVYVPSSFSLSTKKRSPGQTATQLSAVEEGEVVSISQFWTSTN